MEKGRRMGERIRVGERVEGEGRGVDRRARCEGRDDRGSRSQDRMKQNRGEQKWK